MIRKVLPFLTALFAVIQLQAQAPSRQSLQKTIDSIANTKTTGLEAKLSQLQSAEKIWRAHYPTEDSFYCYLLRQIGFTFMDLKDFENAATQFQRSVGIINANINRPSIKPADRINAYYWLSIFYDSLNNITEKIKAADNCIDVAFAMGKADNFSCVRCLYAKVEYYYDMGDYYSCIKAADQCEKYAEAYISTAPGADYISKARRYAWSAVGWRVNAMFRTGNVANAEQVLSAKISTFKKAGLRDYLALTYTELAELYKEKAERNQALAVYQKALAAYRENGDTFSCKQTLNNMGQLIALQNNQEALRYYRQALQYQSKGKYSEESNTFETMDIYGNIANLYLQRGMYDSAFRYYQVAMDQLVPGIDETGILKIPRKQFLNYKDLQGLAALVIDKGDACLNKFYRTANKKAGADALRIYKSADMLLSRIRSGQSELKSKLLWRRNSHRLYEHAIDLCYRLNNTSDAFYFFERSTAVLLSEQLNEQRGAGTTEISRLAQVNKRIVILETKAEAAKNNPKEYAALQDQLFVSTQERQRLEETIRANNPLYYQGIDTNFVSLTDVKTKLLKDRQGLIEIFSGDSAVYCLLIFERNNYLHKISKTEFEATVTTFNKYISDPALLNRDYAGFRDVSSLLYHLLFEQVKVPAGRIVVSTGGRNFPLEALIVNNTGTDPVYFLAEHAVSYTYSARYLMNSFTAGNTGANHFLLGVAPVQFGSSLAPLSGSDGSLKTIRSYLHNAQLQLIEQATRSNFLRAFGAYKVIQLYTHAADTSARNEPVIYFADSALYLSELITGEKPATQLIVLSACETGKGFLYQGEGVFSFSRGFAAMGIPSCIANLWSVDNVSTYRLTELFYQHLAKGLPLDVALQKAKLDYLATAKGSDKLPYYWSPAILVGMSEPVKQGKGSAMKYYLTGIILLVLTGGGLWVYRRKKIRQ